MNGAEGSWERLVGLGEWGYYWEGRAGAGARMLSSLKPGLRSEPSNRPTSFSCAQPRSSGGGGNRGAGLRCFSAQLIIITRQEPHVKGKLASPTDFHTSFFHRIHQKLISHFQQKTWPCIKINDREIPFLLGKYEASQPTAHMDSLTLPSLLSPSTRNYQNESTRQFLS